MEPLRTSITRGVVRERGVMKVMAVRWREMEEGEVVCPLPAVAVYDDEEEWRRRIEIGR